MQFIDVALTTAVQEGAKVVVAALLVHVVSVVKQGPGIFQMIRALPVLMRAYRHGVVGFYGDRDDIKRLRKEPTPSAYIEATKKSLVYVGIVFDASEINLAAVRTAIEANGARVEIVFWGAGNAGDIQRMATYLNRPTLAADIEGAWAKLKAFKQSLDGYARSRLILMSHNEIIVNSVFMRDFGDDDGELFLDVKLYEIGSRSLAIQLRPPKGSKKNKLYTVTAESFRAIRDRSSLVS